MADPMSRRCAITSLFCRDLCELYTTIVRLGSGGDRRRHSKSASVPRRVVCVHVTTYKSKILQSYFVSLHSSQRPRSSPLAVIAASHSIRFDNGSAGSPVSGSGRLARRCRQRERAAPRSGQHGAEPAKSDESFAAGEWVDMAAEDGGLHVERYTDNVAPRSRLGGARRDIRYQRLLICCHHGRLAGRRLDHSLVGHDASQRDERAEFPAPIYSRPGDPLWSTVTPARSGAEPKTAGRVAGCARDAPDPQRDGNDGADPRQRCESSADASADQSGSEWDLGRSDGCTRSRIDRAATATPASGFREGCRVHARDPPCELESKHAEIP
jgi:hypothetical protein